LEGLFFNLALLILVSSLKFDALLGLTSSNTSIQLMIFSWQNWSPHTFAHTSSFSITPMLSKNGHLIIENNFWQFLFDLFQAEIKDNQSL